MFCVKCGSKCEEFMEGENLRQKCTSCGYIHYKNPYPCIAVLIANDRGEILLGKRGKDSIYPGRWCLPCGYIEYDETYLEAAVREVQEEAGITVMPDGIINVVSNHFPNGVHSLVVVLLGHYSGVDVLTPGDDIVDAGWFSIEDMTKLPPLAFSADTFIITKYKTQVEKYGKIPTLTLEGSRSAENGLDMGPEGEANEEQYSRGTN